MNERVFSLWILYNDTIILSLFELILCSCNKSRAVHSAVHCKISSIEKMRLQKLNEFHGETEIDNMLYIAITYDCTDESQFHIEHMPMHLGHSQALTAISKKTAKNNFEYH